MKKRLKYVIVFILCLFFIFILIYQIHHFVFQGHHDKILKKCRLELLKGYDLIGEIDDFTLYMDKPLSIYKIKWNLTADKNVHFSNIVDQHEKKVNMQTCLTKLFDSYHIDLEIENDDIVKLENDMLIPLKKGETSIAIQITTDYSDSIKSPPPYFVDTVEIKVEN